MNSLLFQSLQCTAHCSRKEDITQFPCVLHHEDDFDQCEVVEAPTMEDSDAANKTKEDLNITESLGMRYEDFDGEETLEMSSEEEGDQQIQINKTQFDLNITESLGMRYEVADDEETYEVERERSQREKPDGFTVMICWLGLAYTGLHTIYSEY